MSTWLDPQTRKKLARFRSLRRGYYSLIIFAASIVLSLFAEILVNSRALVVHYDGQWYFPTYGAFHSGRDFGLDYDHEVNYRELQQKFAADGAGNWLVMPLVPYNPFENDLRDGTYPPFPPSLTEAHYLGTDKVGRDVLARLVYGFRIAIWFSLLLLMCDFCVGIVLGSMMGYFGGWFDLLLQRIIEVWANVPFLYVVIILSSILVPTFWLLVGIMVSFGWMHMTWYMRTIAYKEKAREYVAAARSIGASHARIMLKHILPNAVSIVVTFAPFAVAGGITSLTALDFLGFGLPAPTPSWGELLAQGTENMDAIWIVGSVTAAMITVLVMVTFIGEAVREAFDPKKFTYYQ